MSRIVLILLLVNNDSRDNCELAEEVTEKLGKREQLEASFIRVSVEDPQLLLAEQGL